MTLRDLTNCVLQQWTPRIGDPEIAGWLTTLAYAVCVLLALAVWQRLGGLRGRAFCGVLALLLAALAINTQLDLQSALAAAGKCLARAQGWYDQRRALQAVFLALLAAGALALALGLAISLKGRLWSHVFAAMGLALVLCHVVLRAASFHHFDRLTGFRVFGMPHDVLIETAGLVLIAVNARSLLRRRSRQG